MKSKINQVKNSLLKDGWKVVKKNITVTQEWYEDDEWPSFKAGKGYIMEKKCERKSVNGVPLSGTTQIFLSKDGLIGQMHYGHDDEGVWSHFWAYEKLSDCDFTVTKLQHLI